MKSWNIIALLLRIFLAVYTVVQIAGQLNFYSMGIGSSRWAKIYLPLDNTGINVLLMAESVGAILAFLGLFNRLAAILLLLVYVFLAVMTFDTTGLEFLLVCLPCIPLVIIGNGSYTLDRMIRG